MRLGRPRRRADPRSFGLKSLHLRAASPCCSSVVLAIGQPSTEPNPRPWLPTGSVLPRFHVPNEAATAEVDSRYVPPAHETGACKLVQTATQRLSIRYGTGERIQFPYGQRCRIPSKAFLVDLSEGTPVIGVLYRRRRDQALGWKTTLPLWQVSPSRRTARIAAIGADTCPRTILISPLS